MALARKHYERTAGVIRRASDADTVGDAVEAVIVGMAETFAADNPRFDRDRFYDACHYCPRPTSPLEER
jgi:hypothetical protein